MSANPETAFSRVLKRFREEARWSKSELARRVGVTPTCVWNWEAGNTEPRSENYFALSEVFGVDVDQLISGRVTTLPDGSSKLSSVRTRNAAPQDKATLPQAIAEAKEWIAELAGTTAENVSISIEY